jgi:hypothetical protein
VHAKVVVLYLDFPFCREMALDDGRFLVSAERFDKLAQHTSIDELTSQGLLRTHPDFRVIALGLPVPAFPGFPLDPPLRSRFQARFVDASDCVNIPVLDPVLRSLQAVNGGLVRLARQADAIACFQLSVRLRNRAVCIAGF